MNLIEIITYGANSEYDVQYYFTAAEAKEVQRRPRAGRLSKSTPTPLLYAFRVLFKSRYGQYRLLTCPRYGLTKDIIVKECKDCISLQRALCTFISEGSYQYAGIGSGLGAGMQAEVSSEIHRVNRGEGDDVIDKLMGWVRRVRLRALSDMAVCHAHLFTKAWTTTRHDAWTDHDGTWGGCSGLERSTISGGCIRRTLRLGTLV